MRDEVEHDCATRLENLPPGEYSTVLAPDAGSRRVLRQVGIAIGLCTGLSCVAGISRSEPAQVVDYLSEGKATVEFSMHGAHYRVPRGYVGRIQTFGGGQFPLVVMRVAFPGFKPLSPETRQCLESAPAFRPPGCIRVEFDILDPQATQAEGYRNFSQFVNRAEPHGPYGYQVWAYGKDDYTQSIFFKAGSSEGKFVFFCSGDPDKLHNPTTGCTGLTKDKSGNAIFFPFPITELGVADQIQQGLVALVNGFNVGGESKP